MRNITKSLILSSPILPAINLLGVDYTAILFAAVFSLSAAYMDEEKLSQSLLKAGISFSMLFFGLTGFFSPVGDTLMLVPGILETLIIYPNLQITAFILTEIFVAIGLFSKWENKAKLGAALILSFITLDVLLLRTFQTFARDFGLTIIAWALFLEDINLKVSYQQITSSLTGKLPSF